MAINAYVGLPGSGKSYGVVENVILPALQAGRVLITNIPLNLDAVGADYDIELVYQVSNDDLLNKGVDLWLAMPGGAVIVLDEVWRIWPAGMKASDLKDYHKEFLAEHRHKVGKDGMTQEIILIVQDLSQISNYVRGLVDTTYRALKMDKLAAKNKYRVDVYSGAQKGPNYPKNVVSSFFGYYKPAIYKYYKSHTKSATGLPGMERVIDDRGVIWKHPVIKYGFPVALILFLFGINSALKFFSGGDVKPASASASPRPAPAARPLSAPSSAPSAPVNSAAAPAPVAPSKPVAKPLAYSKVWRVVGVSGSSGRLVYHLQHAVRGSRRLGSDSCRQDSIREFVCEVDGELVTSWTGSLGFRGLDELPSSGVQDARRVAVGSSGGDVERVPVSAVAAPSAASPVSVEPGRP